MSASDQAFLDTCRCVFGQEIAHTETRLGPGSRFVLQDAVVDGTVACAFDLSGGATLIDCSFKNVTFERSDLSEARFVACTFESCRFLDCILESCCFVHCGLQNVAFQGDASRMDRARFEDCQFSKLLVGDVRAKRVEFTASEFKCATFQRSRLDESKFLSNKLDRATFCECSLEDALFSRNCLERCTFDGVRIDGIGAWSNTMDATSRSNQRCLLDKPGGQVRVNNLETSHFHSIIGNVSYSYLIDELCEKCVLLLGRFTDGNRETLECLECGLRAEGLLPIVFDFERPKSRNLTETVSIFAHMSMFVVADLSDQRSVGHELQALVPRLAIPVVPIIRGDASPYAMFSDYATNDRVLGLVRFASLSDLSAMIKTAIVEPAIAELRDIERKRARFSERSLSGISTEDGV